jgi:hypothetical protein
MPRIAAVVIDVGVIAMSIALLIPAASRRAMPAVPDPGVLTPAVAPRPRCPGWTATALPVLGLIDVEARTDDDVWLLTSRGIYHFDGCTWQAHHPFDELAGHIIEWQTISRDPDGALVITGESPPGPQHRHGCIVEQSPPQQRSYRFSGALWEQIERRPRSEPELDVTAPRLDASRKLIATSGSFAIVERSECIGHADGDGVVRGCGTTRSRELWRRTHVRCEEDAWSIVMSWPASMRFGLPDLADPPRPSGVPADMRVTGVGGSSAHDVWAVGYRDDVMPEILHFDGRTWTSHRGRFRRDMQYHLTGVTSTGPNDVWVIGTWGTMLHYDGMFWTEVEKPSFYDLRTVVAIAGSLWVADNAGGVFTRRLLD